VSGAELDALLQARLLGAQPPKFPGKVNHSRNILKVKYGVVSSSGKISYSLRQTTLTGSV
jgi:hypothetical protein